MSNREDNLKKINDELEKLSDEDLENIAGGTIRQTSEDSKFLYKYGLVSDYHGTIATTFGWSEYSKEVDNGWAKAGITCVTKPMSDNQYFMNGKEITLGQAVAHVQKNFKEVNKIQD